jgi:hypothetical protein
MKVKGIIKGDSQSKNGLDKALNQDHLTKSYVLIKGRKYQEISFEIDPDVDPATVKEVKKALEKITAEYGWTVTYNEVKEGLGVKLGRRLPLLENMNEAKKSGFSFDKYGEDDFQALFLILTMDPDDLKDSKEDMDLTAENWKHGEEMKAAGVEAEGYDWKEDKQMQRDIVKKEKAGYTTVEFSMGNDGLYFAYYKPKKANEAKQVDYYGLADSVLNMNTKDANGAIAKALGNKEELDEKKMRALVKDLEDLDATIQVEKGGDGLQDAPEKDISDIFTKHVK